MTESSLAAIGALESSEGYQALLAQLDSELQGEIATLLTLAEPQEVLSAHAKVSAMYKLITSVRGRVRRYASEYSASAYPDPVGT